MSEENKPQDKAAAFMAKYQDLMTGGLKDRIHELTEVIKASEERAKIPEPVFRQVFLPYFTGEADADKNFRHLQQWAGLTGSATTWADVVNEKGEVIFEVPPPLNTDDLNVEKTGRGTAGILTEFASQMRLHPALGAQVLAENWPDKLETILGDENKVSKGEQAWAKIRQHYNIEPKDGTAPAASEGTGDEFEF